MVVCLPACTFNDNEHIVTQHLPVVWHVFVQRSDPKLNQSYHNISSDCSHLKKKLHFLGISRNLFTPY